MPKQVQIVEVGPRDGLQNEAIIATVPKRITLIQQLANAGLNMIEAGSFNSPKWVPQMANTDLVLKGLAQNTSTRLPVLVPNLRGMEDALRSDVRDIAVFTAASETFSQKNTNCSIDEGLERFKAVFEVANQNNIKVRGYISCVLGCPYEGEISALKVVHLAEQLIEIGCYEVSLGDTIGVGTPLKTKALITKVGDAIGIDKIAVHFHDTFGQALANILSSLELGVSTVDSSIAGLGGCPYAKGASGNVATEDLVYMLHGMNIDTGVNLDALINIGRDICNALSTPVRSKVNLASH